jgi:hypothetical protein
MKIWQQKTSFNESAPFHWLESLLQGNSSQRLSLQVKASASERKIRKRDNDGRWIYDDLYRIHKNHKVLQVVSQVASSWVVRPPWCSVICLRINCMSLSETVEICGIQVVLHVVGIFIFISLEMPWVSTSAIFRQSSWHGGQVHEMYACDLEEAIS